MVSGTMRGAILAAVALCSSAVHAVTIGFDALAPGTLVTDEFSASGARFIGSFSVVNNTFGGTVTVPSSPNYIQVGAGPPVLRFVDPADPARPAMTTSVSIVTPALAAGGCFNAIDLSAFDRNGAFLGNVVVPAVDPQGAAQRTTTLALQGIHELQMTNLGGGCIAPFDDLVFATVVPTDLFADGFE